ncbi:dihydrofolate reductase family protein [Microbacterium sp.]|uniref:dihydrofolate reductase family protein n=1 Tax=Microbacterium sp. TaxID=51671 RepID=UPI002811B60F|nr:dihydrofolate reductase family protein [Microbacterium sp.]
MPRVRAHNFSVSLDGFGTGQGLSLDAPFGHAGMRLHEWFFPTETFQARAVGRERMDVDPSTAPDDAFASQQGRGIGVEIMGAGKYGPPGWQDDPDWRGWWGEEPPFHTPVIVLTHRPRDPLPVGETTFHFLDAPPIEALAAARDLAGGRDIHIGGGPTMLRDFLAEGLVDHAHIAVVPILLGRGVRLWDGLEALEARYDIASVTTPSGTTHLTLDRKVA